MRSMRICMGKSWLFLVAVYVMCVMVCPLRAEVFFSDNFESGNLNLWTIDGRQGGLANVANVVDRNSSKMGHLYHQGLTEISIEKRFDFDENLAFSFDFEANVTTGGTGSKYASGEAEFWFLGSGNNVMGLVSYTKATSNYIFDLDDLTHKHFRIPNEAGLATYAPTIQDLLSNITIEEDLISSVRFRFIAYCSEAGNLYSSNVWVDNVVVTPEPATIALMAIGAIAVFRKRR